MEQNFGWGKISTLHGYYVVRTTQFFETKKCACPEIMGVCTLLYSAATLQISSIAPSCIIRADVCCCFFTRCTRGKEITVLRGLQAFPWNITPK